MAQGQGITYLNDENFHEEVATGVTLVDFYAEWCGPCRALAPILEKISKDPNNRAKIAKLDIESAPETTQTFEVTSIPTLILLKDGKEVDRVVGVRNEADLESMINSAL